MVFLNVSARPQSSRSIAGRTFRLSPALPVIATLLSSVGMVHHAHAQAAAPRNLVSACSGVSLPPSVVTGILTPVVNGIVNPIEGSVNDIVALPLVGGLLGPLNVDTTTLLNNAAAGQPISLQVLNVDGTVVGPADRCDLQADSFGLNTEGGIAIGGNRITGLGTNGQEALASTADSIAFGNGAQATAANSVAIGTGSVASRGAQAGYAALGLADAQNSAGEFSVGAVGAERQITNVAAGTAPTDAVNVGQLAGVAMRVEAVGNAAVLYDGSAKDRVTLAGAGGTVVTNVAPGTLAATSTDAVNGSQLFATDANVANNTTAIANLTTNINNGAVGALRYSDPAAPTVPNGGVPTNDTTLVGATADPVSLHNLADGLVAAGSTDAVNGGQLFATNTDVANNTTAITNLGNDVTNLGNNLTNLSASVTNGSVGTVQYANDDTPTAPNGGTPTNDLTLVGATAAPVQLHNVADGAILANSTDAINGGQVYGLAFTAVNAVSYDADANGARSNTVTLSGGDPAAPVTITNLANGAVTPGSTSAVNGSQLYATQQTVSAAQTTANSALTLGQNSVQYDSASRTSITLGSGGGGAGGGSAAPVTLSNVGAGRAATDAVNVAQLGTGLSNALGQANSYTDQRLLAVSYDLRSMRRDGAAGTAGALAAAGLPQAYTAGAGMIAFAAGTYQGQSAMALGFSKAFDDGHTVVKMSGSVDTRGKAGAAGGVGYQF